MDETALADAAALTTGSILAPGGSPVAAGPDFMILTAILLLTAVIMCILAAYRSTTGPAHTPPARPVRRPALGRRTRGPRDRRV